MSAKEEERTFVSAVLAGDALETDINDFVEQWRNSNDNRKLAGFLGLSDQEYALWVEQPESIRTVLYARRHRIDLDQVLNWNEAHALAARSMTSGEADVLIRWLRQQGLLE